MSLNTIHKKIWEDLEEGVTNSKSGFHFPVISTIDKNGHPSSRTVVLRKIEKKNKIISFNTDIRSNKWLEIKHNEKISVNIYDNNKKTQIRILGIGVLNYNNTRWNSAWKSTPNMSRECYSTPYSPSSIIKEPEDIDNCLKNKTDKEFKKFKANFGRIDVHIHTLDWLYLIHTGHRRAKFTYNKKISMNWLAP